MVSPLGGLMKAKRYVYAGTIPLGVVAGGVTVMLPLVEPVAAPPRNAALVAPTFKVDPFWPKALPDNWVTGEVGGTCIDSQDHLFIVTRGFQTGGLVSPEGIGGGAKKTRTPRGPFKSKGAPPGVGVATASKVGPA